MSYITKSFLLNNKTAEKLYYTYANEAPIFDYHCHLPEKQILENKPFNDIYEVWLQGDHYKWRLMRNYGVNEEYITGNKTNKEKFLMYCKVLQTAFANPLYHWSQVELSEYFNCELEINEENAEEIWDKCNQYIKDNNITPQKLIEGSNVKYLFTTNEIFDDLSVFERIKEKGYNFLVAPAFRADKLMGIEASSFVDVVEKLVALTHKIDSLDDLEKAIEIRLNEFIKVGCKATDISLEYIYPVYSKELANNALIKALNKEELSELDIAYFKGYITYYLFKLYAKYHLATELHIGAMRNNNHKQFTLIGADTGYDSVSDANSIKLLSRLFDRLNDEDSLPKTIVFNLNPKMNTEIMTLIGCFQDHSAKGKIQYGPAWWFLDNKQGMEKHLLDLTATGHIGAFVGMLTDSRSFLSYPRHKYFRRIVCNFFGEMMEKGEMTNDIKLVGKVVEDLCINNAKDYFGV